MGRIFISYRRGDSAGYAGRLYDRLTQQFGKEGIFMDIDAIPPGENFVKAIRDSVNSCEVLIALIGKSWATLTDEKGKRRLANRMDFIRLEIETALERDILVIPVLVGGGSIPRAEHIPKALQKLSELQGIELTDTRFHTDVDRLISAIVKKVPLIAKRETKPRRGLRPTRAARKSNKHSVSDKPKSGYTR